MKAEKKSKIIDTLERYAKEHNVQVTAPRKHVLEIVSASEKVLTAYEILEKLGARVENPKPPTVYRALEFLVQHGFIHRIESLNAYVSCAENHNHRGSQFMICDSCGQVEEIHLCHIPKGLEDASTGKGFSLSYWNAELHGLCEKCC